MKTITLPADTERLYLDEVAHLIADCLNPQGPNDPEGTRYKAALEALAPELEQAATSGTLRTRHPETLGPLPPVVLSADPVARLLDGTYSMPLRFRVVTVPDFAAYVADRGISVVIEAPEQTPQTQTATPAPEETDLNQLPVFQIQARPLFVPPELEAMNPTAQIRFIDRVGTTQGDGISTAGDLLEVIRATISRQAAGYFTIDEASQILSDATGSPVKTQLEKLRRAIAEKVIHALDQDDKMPVLGTVRNFLSVLRVSEIIAAGFAFPNAPQPAPAQNTTTPAPVVTEQVEGDGIDFAVLASPAQLIAAFGRFTGMDASWFDKWADYPVLKNAMKVKGTSGRGRTTEPLFCPFLVMQGLMKKPRKGSNRRAFLTTEKPWELLKRHFADVYATHQGLSPLDD